MAKLWIIKDSLNHIQGPYETKEILEQIKSGVFSGEESIAAYPEGSFKKISSEPEFFDYLLMVISGEEEGNAFDFTKVQEKENEGNEEEDLLASNESSAVDQKEKSSEENQVRPQDFNQGSESFPEEVQDSSDSFVGGMEDFNEGLEPFEKKKKKSAAIRAVQGRSHLFEDRQRQSLSQLEDLKLKTEKRKKTQNVLYFLFVIGVGLALSFFLFEEEKAPVEDTALYTFKIPERSKGLIKIKDLTTKKKAFSTAYALMATDEIKNLIKAQRIFADILKYEARNPRALLQYCNNNFRLWPYTARDQKNLLVVSEISKRAYASGVSGESLLVCRLVEKILYGKLEEAQEMADGFLNTEEGMEGLSFYLRFYKGYLLLLKGEKQLASSFLENSVQIESSWIPSLMLLGKVYIERNRSQAAYNVFKKVLKINPRHIDALLQISILNTEFFGKFKIGLKYLSKALSLKKEEHCDAEILSKAYSVHAKYYLKAGKIAKAKEFGEKAFGLDSSNVEAKNILISTGSTTEAQNADRLVMAEAEKLFNEKEWKAAIAIYEQAYKMNPKNSLAAIRIAESYWKQNFVKDAVNWAEVAISSGPKRVDSYITLSDFLINLFEMEKARRVLAKARILAPTNYLVYRNFARIEMIEKNYLSAAAYAKKALKLYSSDSESILILSRSLEQTGEIEKAFANATAAMEVSRSSFELENYYVGLLMKIRGLDQAKLYLEERLASSGGQLKYRVMLSNIYFLDEQYREAIEVAQKVNEVTEGEMWEAVMSYAEALGAYKKAEEALDQFQKAFLLKPTDPSPLFKSALMLIENQRYKSAIKQIERVFSVSPRYPELYYYWAEASKKIAEQGMDKKMAEQAIKYAKRELSLNSTYVKAYLLIAESYYVLGNIASNKARELSSSSPKYSQMFSEMISWYKLCSKNYQKAIDLAVQSGNTYIDMARCYRLSGQIDHAIASANKAEEVDKSNPLIWTELALIQEQSGNYNAALKAYKKFLLIFPNAPNKLEVEAKINELAELVEEE